MQTLDDVVRSTVQSFVKDEVLFTALDVSNKVKETLPFARHREVRDLVRGMFAAEIEPTGWARTPITVTLLDSSTAEALLYHPLSASWDLDNAYSTQQRTAAKSSVTAPVPAKVSANGTVSVNPVTVPAPSVVTPVPPVVSGPAAQVHARSLWDQMFKSQPSLFPRR